MSHEDQTAERTTSAEGGTTAEKETKTKEKERRKNRGEEKRCAARGEAIP